MATKLGHAVQAARRRSRRRARLNCIDRHVTASCGKPRSASAARVDIRREHPPAGFGVGAQTKSDESGSTDSAMCLESTALDAVPVLGKPLLLLPTAPHGCGPPKRRTLQYHRARARGRERIHNGSSLASTLASTFNVCPPATRDAIDAEKIDRWLSRTSATPPAIRPPYRP